MTPAPGDIAADPALADDPALVDVIDRLLARGVVVRGDLWLSIADVKLVYVGAQLVIATPEALRAAGNAGNGRLTPTGETRPTGRIVP